MENNNMKNKIIKKKCLGIFGNRPPGRQIDSISKGVCTK